MAILTNPSPTSLSAVVPISPPTGTWTSDDAPSSSSDPVAASFHRLDVTVEDDDKENSPRGRPSDTVLRPTKCNKRRKTNVVSPTKGDGNACLSSVEETPLLRQSTKFKKSLKPMKEFEEDYYSALQYKKEDEHERDNKKLRFKCFAQVKEIPSHRDYEPAELDQMYTDTRTIKENANRNTTEMWHDVGYEGRRQDILERAAEEDSFHIYQMESGETEFIHPATYSVWLEEQQEKEKREMESWCNENSTFLVEIEKALGGDCYDTFGDNNTEEEVTTTFFPNAEAASKTHEVKHSGVFRFGGKHSTKGMRELEYECDYGFETVDLDGDDL